MHVTVRDRPTRRARGTAGLAAALLGAVVLLTSIPAAAIPPGGADPDTPGTASSVSPKELRAGDTIGFEVRGFPPGETLYIKIDDGLDCGEAAVHGACVYHQQRIPSSGTVTGSFTLPADIAPGAHWLRFLASEEILDAEGNILGVNGYTRRGGADFTVVAGDADADVDPGRGGDEATGDSGSDDGSGGSAGEDTAGAGSGDQGSAGESGSGGGDASGGSGSGGEPRAGSQDTPRPPVEDGRGPAPEPDQQATADATDDVTADAGDTDPEAEAEGSEADAPDADRSYVVRYTAPAGATNGAPDGRVAEQAEATPAASVADGPRSVPIVADAVALVAVAFGGWIWARRRSGGRVAGTPGP